MKKIGALIFLNLALLLGAEELVTEIKLKNDVIDEKLEIQASKEELIKGKKYLLDYLKKSYDLEFAYSGDMINKVILKKDNDQIIYEYFSFDKDKISKISEETPKYHKNSIFHLNKRLKSVETIEGNFKKYEEYYENGNLKTKGKFEYSNSNWNKIGVWEEYYDNSKLGNRFVYEKDGFYQTNYNNDNSNSKNYEGKTLNSGEKTFKDGLWTFYKNNEIDYKGEFSKENGKIYKYYDKEANTINSVTSVVLKNDQWEWEGEKTYYTVDGKILEKQLKYEDTLYSVVYYPNEVNGIRCEGLRNIDGNSFDKIGIWNYYAEDGTIEEVITYNGDNAEVKEYYDFLNNELKFEGNISKKANIYSWTGNQLYYNKKGNKETQIIFDGDGKGRIQHFFDNGSLFQEGEVYSDYMKNLTYYLGNLAEYDENGKLKIIYNYENGVLNGETLFFDNNNKPSVKKIYENGELVRIENIK